MPSQILVVEDHHPLRLSLTVLLREHGHAVVAFASAEEALLHTGTAPPELAIVDWNLPGQSGLWLVERWRSDGRVPWPCILLTARGDVEDRVAGLDAGASDYLVKPFANEELLARIRAALRAGRPTAPSSDEDEIVLSGVRVWLRRQELERDGVTAPLTTKEIELLRYLVAHPGRVLDRSELLREVWGYRGAASRAVDNTVLRLRGKVERDPAHPRHILTVFGDGYRFEP